MQWNGTNYNHLTRRYNGYFQLSTEWRGISALPSKFTSYVKFRQHYINSSKILGVFFNELSENVDIIAQIKVLLHQFQTMLLTAPQLPIKPFEMANRSFPFVLPQNPSTKEEVEFFDFLKPSSENQFKLLASYQLLYEEPAAQSSLTNPTLISYKDPVVVQKRPSSIRIEVLCGNNCLIFQRRCIKAKNGTTLSSYEDKFVNKANLCEIENPLLWLYAFALYHNICIHFRDKNPDFQKLSLEQLSDSTKHFSFDTFSHAADQLPANGILQNLTLMEFWNNPFCHAACVHYLQGKTGLTCVSQIEREGMILNLTCREKTVQLKLPLIDLSLLTDNRAVCKSAQTDTTRHTDPSAHDSVPDTVYPSTYTMEPPIPNPFVLARGEDYVGSFAPSNGSHCPATSGHSHCSITVSRIN